VPHNVRCRKVEVIVHHYLFPGPAVVVQEPPLPGWSIKLRNSPIWLIEIVRIRVPAKLRLTSKDSNCDFTFPVIAAYPFFNCWWRGWFRWYMQP